MCINSPCEWEGKVQVYTGNGKGKTTASFGLAMRAAGAGLKVFIAQFVKGMKYSEIKSFEKMSDCIEIHQYGTGCFINRNPNDEDILKAKEGLAEVKRVVSEGKHRLVILDEANIAVFYKLFTVDDLLDLIENKSDTVELVITGRQADPRLLEKADLVTEMREVKHYYKTGLKARKGIES